MIGIGIGFNIKGGRVLSNILGHDGSCESLAPFTVNGTVVALSSTQKKGGTNSIKFTDSGTFAYVYKDYSFPLSALKQYFVGAWVYIESFTSGIMQVLVCDIGTFTVRYSAVANTTTIGSWQFVYVKVPTSNILVGSGFRFRFGSFTATTATAYFDEIRLYEVSASDYTAIGTTWTAVTTPSIDDIFPYRDTP